MYAIVKRSVSIGSAERLVYLPYGLMHIIIHIGSGMVSSKPLCSHVEICMCRAKILVTPSPLGLY